MQLKTGDRIGDYEILGVLGAGGMGSVYKVRNVISDRVEALKLLLPNLVEHPDLKERFLREIKTSASLEHPAIAGLRTAFQSGDMLLMVMEFVEGQTLDGRLRQGGIAIDEAVRITARVLDALEYAHSRGVVHRDIKPANIMLGPKGAVKLLDFGIAKAATDKQITVAGTTMGSLYYMSPEQIRGEQVDGRADLYSLGITLYELTTGKRPFGGDSGYAIMAEHLQKQPVPPLELAPEMPAALSWVILRSLAKNPDDRYQTAAEFRQDLLSVLSPEEATQIGTMPVGGAAAAATTAAAKTSPSAPLPPTPPTAPTVVAQPSATPVPPAVPPPAAPPAFAPAAPVFAPAPPANPVAPPANAAAAAPAVSYAAADPPATRKPSNTLALVMVALIAVIVLAAVLMVFAGSWFFGSGDTAVASAQPNLVQRISSLFSGSASSEGSADASAQPTSPTGETAEPDAQASLDALNGEPPADSAAAQGQMADPSLAAVAGAAVSSPGRGTASLTVGKTVTDTPRMATATSSQGVQRGAAPASSGSVALPPVVSSASPEVLPSVSAPAAPAGPDPQALEAANEFFSKLGVRAGVVQESARKLSEEQSAMGVSLRADMRAALKRMEYLMDQAEASLGRGNLDQARQQMQSAEREIEKLEKFFRI